MLDIPQPPPRRRRLFRQNRRILRDEYYDADTATLFKERLTDDDKNMIRRNHLREHAFLRGQWATIVLSLSDAYLDEYYSLRVQVQRDQWMQKYLDLESHELSRMPETLLPL
jgi:hypothetical protein